MAQRSKPYSRQHLIQIIFMRFSEKCLDIVTVFLFVVSSCSPIVTIGVAKNQPPYETMFERLRESRRVPVSLNLPKSLKIETVQGLLELGTASLSLLDLLSLFLGSDSFAFPDCESYLLDTSYLPSLVSAG